MTDPVERARELWEEFDQELDSAPHPGMVPLADPREAVALLADLADRCEAQEREIERLRKIEVAAHGFADHVSHEDHEPDDFIDSDVGPPVCIQDGQVWPCFVERLHAALTGEEEG